jgi:hypothetical protein
MTTSSTHSHQVSEQHLLGPAVEQARYERGTQVLAAIDGEGGQSIVNASLNVGLTPTEIVEAITHTAVYCGFPKALNAIFVAKRVFAEHDLLPGTAPAA